MSQNPQPFQKELANMASQPALQPCAAFTFDFAGNLQAVNPITTHLFPELANIGSPNPGPSDPGPPNPGPPDPGPLDPGPSDPGPSDPGPSDPAKAHPILQDLQAVVKVLQDEAAPSLKVSPSGSVGPSLIDEIHAGNSWYQRTFHLEAHANQIRLFVLDITKQKQATEALEKERHLLRTLIDNLPDYIFVKDMESRFIINNQAHLNALGVDAQEEVIGRSDFDYFPQALVKQYYADEQIIIQSGESLVDREEMTIPSDGTNQWLSTTKVPLRGRDGSIVGLVGMCRDITQRREAELKLQKTANELARSNAELEQFAYVASHDLQEPLRAITGYIQLLQRRYADQLDERAVNFIERSVAAANRMKGLIEGLLAYSRVGRRDTPFIMTDCSKLVAQTLNDLAPIIEESHATVAYDSLPTVKGDAILLGQLIQNLVSNAIKFRGTQHPEVHIAALSKGSEWLFSVRDNGIGIESEYVDRIFLIFQRLHTRTEYPGTGIGLAMCKKIVEYHGGRIWVKSEVGRGTTFFFTLPK
ncbi:MAG: ATP-binding protein [Chloroflexota bacterium]